MSIATTNIDPFVWQDYGCPAADVARCVCIGISGESARLAREFVARWPVLFANAAARRTGPTGIARVNKFNRHSDKPALVGDLRLKVSESPRVQDSALLSGSPDPRTNMRQIFQRNSPLRAFSNCRNLFGDGVVCDLHKPSLASAQTEQDSLGRARAFGLKAFSLTPTAGTDACNLAGIAENLAVGTFGDIGQSQINTKPANCFLLPFFRHVHRNVQKPFTVAKNQIRLAFRKFKQFALAFAAYKRKMFESAFDRPKADGGLIELEIQNSSIVGNASMLSERALCFLVKFVSVGDFRVEPDNNLSGQRKLSTNLFVKQSVHRKLAELFIFPSQLRQAISRSIGCFQRLAQSKRLFFLRQKFNLHCQCHSVNLLKCLNLSNNNL